MLRLPRDYRAARVARLTGAALALSLLAVAAASIVVTRATPASNSTTRALETPGLPPDLAALGRVTLIWRGQLWVSRGDGQLRSLVSSPAGGSLRDPAWRPGTDEVTFTEVVPPDSASGTTGSDLGLSSEIWSVGDDGLARRILRDATGGSRVSQPVWSPDGQSLYFVREIPFRHDGLAGVTSRIEQLDVTTDRLAVVVTGGVWPAISPSGTLLAYAAFNAAGAADLWVVDLRSGVSRQLTDGRFVNVSSPRFSPDGQTIAFGGAAVDAQGVTATSPRRIGPPGILTWLAPTAAAHEYLSAIWLIGSDGQAMRPVSSAVYDVPIVRWSGNFRQLLVYDEDALFEVDLIGRGRRVVLPIGDYSGFDWRAQKTAP